MGGSMSGGGAASRCSIPVRRRDMAAGRGSGLGGFRGGGALGPSFGIVDSFCCSLASKSADWAGEPGSCRMCTRQQISSRRRPDVDIDCHW